MSQDYGEIFCQSVDTILLKRLKDLGLINTFVESTYSSDNSIENLQISLNNLKARIDTLEEYASKKEYTPLPSKEDIET